jgi:hypothetical protein
MKIPETPEAAFVAGALTVYLYAKLDRHVALDWRCLRKLTARNYRQKRPVIISSMRKQVKNHLRKRQSISGLGNILDAAMGSLN